MDPEGLLDLTVLSLLGLLASGITSVSAHVEAVAVAVAVTVGRRGGMAVVVLLIPEVVYLRYGVVIILILEVG